MPVATALGNNNSRPARAAASTNCIAATTRPSDIRFQLDDTAWRDIPQTAVDITSPPLAPVHGDRPPISRPAVRPTPSESSRAGTVRRDRVTGKRNARMRRDVGRRASR